MFQITGRRVDLKIVIIGQFPEKTKQRIREVFPPEFQLSIVPADRMYDDIVDADVIIPEHQSIDGAFLDRTRNLKLVQTGAGFDNVVVEECTKRGVYVANAAGVNAAAVAEHVMALILCWYKNLVTLDRTVKEGGYSVEYVGSELSGKTIGIVGFGNVGRNVARLARAFTMKVLAYSRRPVQTETEVEFTELKTLLKLSDVFTLHTSLNNQTRHMIGRKEFECMKKDAFLINTSRGPVVDEVALIEVLQHNRIAGAALDVFETEPLSVDSPLRKLNNVILTPHTAGLPDGTKFSRKRYEFFLKNAKRVSAGQEPLNLINEL